MKKVLFLLLVLAFISFSYVFAFNNSLVNKVIYIDPGHGGYDPGASYKNIRESDINLEYSLKLKELFEKEGAIVYLTRYEDYDLSTSTTNHKKNDIINRINLINNSNADIFLSIHLNSETSNLWNGAQIFYDSINKKNKDIANLIQSQLKKDKLTKRDEQNIENLLLLKNVKIPGVLIELGFISNYNDRKNLQNIDYENKICMSIVEAIKKYYKK